MADTRRNLLRTGAWGVLLGTCAVYALALNPYLLPATYDNVLYHVAGQAIAETGTYTFGGWSIWDWPPGFAVMLAAPALFGLDSVLAAKIVVYFSVALGAGLALALLRRERRPWAILSVSIAVLVPTAFLQGTRVMSDWPFAALAFLFLYLLDRLERPRERWFWAVLLGALLGAATLTRHVGVCLGAALVVLAWNGLRAAGPGRRLRALGAPALVALIGGAMVIGWRLIMHPHVVASEAWASYQQELDFLDHLSVTAFSKQVWDVTMHGTWVFENVLGAGGSGLTSVAAIAVTALVAYGGYRQMRSNGVRPSDGYVLASAALVATIEWKHARYLLPIAPFLASYLAWGIERAFRWTGDRWATVRWWGVRVAIGLWLLALIAMDAWLVVEGNDETHRGLASFVSRSPASFYVGAWHDLERASAHIRENGGDGAVLVLGRDDLKYPAYFTRRPIARIPEGDAAAAPLDTATLCAMRPPYRPGSGLTLFGEDGEPIGPLWTVGNGLRVSAHGCAIRQVLVEGEPPALAPVAAALGLSAPETFGRFRVYAVPDLPSAREARR